MEGRRPTPNSEAGVQGDATALGAWMQRAFLEGTALVGAWMQRAFLEGI